jgi:peroxiredoxin
MLRALVFTLVVGLCSSAWAGVREGDRATDFSSLKDFNKKRVKLKQYRGKVVVLTFGASWCKPCKKELPALEKLSRKYSKKKVQFLAVNIDESKAEGLAFVKRSGPKNVRALYDKAQSSVKAYDPPKMPSTYVIDQKGIVRHLHAGYNSGDDKKIAKHIDKLVK